MPKIYVTYTFNTLSEKTIIKRSYRLSYQREWRQSTLTAAAKKRWYLNLIDHSMGERETKAGNTVEDIYCSQIHKNWNKRMSQQLEDTNQVSTNILPGFFNAVILLADINSLPSFWTEDLVSIMPHWPTRMPGIQTCRYQVKTKL